MAETCSCLTQNQSIPFGPVIKYLCAVEFGFLSTRTKGMGKVVEAGDRCRLFLAWSPGFCSEELFLPESVREEEVQPFSLMRVKGSVQMVLMGLRTWRVPLLNRGKEHLV